MTELRKWEQDLFDKYPEMFLHKDNIQASLMGWGFAVGDGWRSLVEELCKYIHWQISSHNKRCDTYERLIKDNETQILKDYWSKFENKRLEFPQVEQVKEKFGGLRFYIGGCATEVFNEINGAIGLAESLSYRMCEDCGNTGKPIAIQGWVRTLCRRCVVDSIQKRELNALAELDILNKYDQSEN